MTQRSAILPLREIAEDSRARVGGKAWGLAALHRAGLPVPEGFVVCADASNDDALRECEAAYADLGGLVAVRSSATHEDGAEASFAGQYRSELGLSGWAAVSAAVARCRQATASAEGYAEALHAPPLREGTKDAVQGRALAVVIQRFVPARAAGVLFTRDPQDASRLLLEAHAGAGEALVSGTVTPDRYRLTREPLALGTAPAAGALSEAEALALAGLALRAESALGGPQDVEWVLDGAGVPWLVQSRPITVEAAPAVDPRLRRLTRANVGEVLPDPVTPLTWTTVGTFLESAFQDLLRELSLVPRDPPALLVLHDERLYLNLSLCLEVAQGLPGLSTKDAERLVLGNPGRGREAEAPPRWTVGTLLRGLGALVVRAPSLVRLASSLPQEIVRADAAITGLETMEVAATLPGAQEALRRFLEVGPAVARTHLATSGASGVRLAVLQRVLSRVAPGDPVALLNRLMGGLSGLASTAPTEALDALAVKAAGEASWLDWLDRAPDSLDAAGGAPPSLRAEMQHFLDAYGHRGLSEGELRARTWSDDPAPVLAALAHGAREPRLAGLARHARSAARSADDEALRSRQGPLGRAVLGSAIAAAQEWVRRREHTKSLSVRLVRHGRRMARAAGAALQASGALRDADDVFFLTADELGAALAGAPVNGPLVARRQRRLLQAARVPAPRELDLGAPTAEPAGGPASWQGLGVSAGLGRGRARVMAAGEVAPLHADEVLVTPVLDAAWGPHLSAAAGAIAEMGGMLSHGAVVARELGVPCVVDLPGATHRIREGELVLVNGGTGLVRVLVEGGAEAAAEAAAAVHPAAPAEDEAFHRLDDDARARESIYLNVQDPRTGLGLVASLGQRPGGRGEALLAVALPDGRRLFSLSLAATRPAANGLSVGSLHYDWSPVALRFRGRAAPHAAKGFPRGALPLLLSRRSVDVHLDLAFSPRTPAVDFAAGLPEDMLRALAPLGRHHVEQSGVWSGRLMVDGTAHDVQGTGSRDHSWGLRDWEAADWWRLFTVRFGDDLALHALVVSAKGQLVEGGFLFRNGQAERLTRILFHARPERGAPDTIDLECASAVGPALRVRGTVLNRITVPVQVSRNPWRHLRARPWRLLLHEGFTRYEAEGRVGYGMAEFTERR